MNDKLTGILLGAVLTVVILSAFGLVTAHGNDNTAESEHEEIMGHMAMGSGMMMHHGMHYEDDGYDMAEHMEGCPMMKGADWHEEMTAEEMDQDGDGFCDICGMPVEECLNMKESGGMMNCHKMMR